MQNNIFLINFNKLDEEHKNVFKRLENYSKKLQKAEKAVEFISYCIKHDLLPAYIYIYIHIYA